MPSQNEDAGYFALVLEPASTERLRQVYATLPKLYAHHCTVAYDCHDPKDLPPYFTAQDLDKTFLLRVTGYKCRHDCALEAVAVELVSHPERNTSRRFCNNQVPHITVATDGNARPSESNALLERGYDRISGEVLKATLKYIPG